MNTTLIRLVGLLAALIGLAWLTGVFDTNPSTIDAPDLRLDADRVSRIQLSRDSLAIGVYREDGVWRLDAADGSSGRAGPRADSGTVARALEKLVEAEVRATVTRSPDRWDRFGVADQALRLDVMLGQGQTRTLFISETGPDFSSSYVRLEGDDRVFSVSPRLWVDPTVDRWRDKRVVRLEPDAIERIEATSAEHAFMLTRSGEGWTLQTSGTTGPASLIPANRLASAFNPFTADGFYDDAVAGVDGAAADPDNTDTRRLEVTAGGETYAFEFVSREGGYAMTLDREPSTTWKVFATRLNTLFPDPETLLDQ